MSTPIGHTLFGVTLARRLGIRSPLGLAAATVAASLPDADVFPGIVLYRDPWKLHRKASHTPGFALTAGMLAGFAGLISAGNAEGERDLIADSLAGALLVGSHILLDNMPFPYVAVKKGTPARTVAGISAFNWLLDAVIYGGFAWKFWPRARSEDQAGRTA